MSDTKRQELIASGALNPDGSRKQRCPTCGTAVGELLTQDVYDERVAAGAATVETVEGGIEQ